MKWILAVIFSVFLMQRMICQDTIIFKSGASIAVKVNEIRKHEVFYFSKSGVTDSLRSVQKKDIFIVKLSDVVIDASSLSSIHQLITYKREKFYLLNCKNGKYYFGDSLINWKMALLIMRDYSQQKNIYKLSKIVTRVELNNALQKTFFNCGMANLSASTYGFATAALLADSNKGIMEFDELSGGFVVVGLIGTILGTSYSVASILHDAMKRAKMTKALKLYNSDLKK